MRIPLDPSSGLPLYAQIAAGVKSAMDSGSFELGSRLPSARRLAEELGVSRVTVETAYAELEVEGRLERRMGSGSFASRAEEVESPAASPQPGASCFGVEPGAGLGLPSSEGSIDFSSGLADPSLFPTAALGEALRKVLRRDGQAVFGYGEPQGWLPFRESVARVLSSRGIAARPEEILITSGSQEAISLTALAARSFLASGREDFDAAGRPDSPRVLVERPSYPAALGLFRALDLEPRGLPSDAFGPDPEALRSELRHGGTALLYLIPNFRNPTGSSIEAGRRREIVRIAEAEGLPVLEDDYVGDLRYEGRDNPALVSLGSHGSVIYAGTFSKMLVPGLRLGFLLARGGLMDRLLELKYCLSISASHIAQRALHELLTVGGYENHLRRSRKLYKARRDALVDALCRELPECSLGGGPLAEGRVGLSIPAGGLFLWLGLPPGLSSRALAAAAAGRGLRLAPSRPFFPDPSDPAADSFVRLNFAALPEERIAEGVKRLAAVLGELGHRSR